jgi:hypothetical protein
VAKVLFILKRREDYNAVTHNHVGLSTGLFNSASFVDQMLTDGGIDSKLVVVTDNNDIDREVTAYQPSHVIIEALWVVPSKFAVLQRLHPTVTWIIRLHSDMPFMAMEGMAMDWLCDYSSFANVAIACNAPRMLREVSDIIATRNRWTVRQTRHRVIYLPNYYPEGHKTKQFDHGKPSLDISCFGAVRPLKNHLLQAIAALEFANRMGKKLRFHINSGRIEGKGEPIMRNLQNLFEQLHPTGHRLIAHDWTPRDRFLELCASMDLGMQVSFSETFNIVGADLISQGVPLVSSAEIPWGVGLFAADPTSSADMARKLHLSWELPWLNARWQQHRLSSYGRETRRLWYRYFKDK